VTLSACQGGMGRWFYGDEIVGLAQAFIGAGAQSVIASLWLAADRHTADLMPTLYARLDSEGPVAALAGMQRSAIAGGLEPYFWAPFSVFGQP
jgi:CHAT domain-containing protein